MKNQSVLADWISGLTFQQQAVVILALRGPDGDKKHTAFKPLLRAYRGTVLKAAKFGRPLNWGEAAGDTFMRLDEIKSISQWQELIEVFLEDEADGSILHHYTHFMHGTQVLAYKHPEERFRDRWHRCYYAFCNRLHLNMEDEDQMDRRLSDWNREHWEREPDGITT